MNLKNSLYKVVATPFNKEILLPTSKSHSNRALIIGAIRGNGFRIQNLSKSTDVRALLRCLETIGLKIVHENDSVVFHNSFPSCESTTVDQIIDLKTGDGGTTNRFLLALLARGKKTYRLCPNEKMSERPIDDLLNPLRILMVSIKKNEDGAWLTIKGPAQMINTSKLIIDCKESTQFASAMMLAFSTLPLSFELINIKASETYLKMTEFILKETLLKNSYKVPGDFSSLSYPLALALFRGSVLVKNCHELDPMQPDSQMIELMKEAGGDIEWSEGGLLATSKYKLRPFNIDGSVCPDLVPTLVFVAAHIEGTSTFKNLSVLRHKESDRLEEIILLLKNLAIDFLFDETRAEIVINGKSHTYPNMTLKTARDHRMVMTAYLFLRANNGGFLAEVDCVEKSFPDFFKILEE
jgi:3-phosphoshikimate 1-carboxyvinyltransferase